MTFSLTVALHCIIDDSSRIIRKGFAFASFSTEDDAGKFANCIVDIVNTRLASEGKQQVQDHFSIVRPIKEQEPEIKIITRSTDTVIMLPEDIAAITHTILLKFEVHQDKAQ